MPCVVEGSNNGGNQLYMFKKDTDSQEKRGGAS